MYVPFHCQALLTAPRSLQDTGQPLIKAGVLEVENTRPDVVIINNGNGGSTKYMVRVHPSR